MNTTLSEPEVKQRIQDAIDTLQSLITPELKPSIVLRTKLDEVSDNTKLLVHLLNYNHKQEKLNLAKIMNKQKEDYLAEYYRKHPDKV